MTRLSQIIAIEKDVKTGYEAIAFTEYKQLAKPEPLVGILKTYQPVDAEGEELPRQEQLVQHTVEKALQGISEVGARLLNVVGAKEKTNQSATATVYLDDKPFIADAPVTFLLALERLLNEELVQAKKLPTLPLDHRWEPSGEDGIYQSEPVDTVRTKKIPRNHVKAAATDKHPAQVEVYYEDTKVGTWTTRQFSGMIPVARKQEILRKLTKLIEAVKQAREEANTTTVTDFKVGSKVYGYIYGGGQ